MSDKPDPPSVQDSAPPAAQIQDATTTSPPNNTAFLCHSGANKPFVREVNLRLLNSGMKTFFDEFSINAGDTLSDCIFEAIRNSGIAVIFCSETFFRSKWPTAELQEFLKRRDSGDAVVTIIPVVIDMSDKDLQLRAPQLSRMKYIRANTEDPFHVQNVVEWIQKSRTVMTYSGKDHHVTGRGTLDPPVLIASDINFIHEDEIQPVPSREDLIESLVADVQIKNVDVRIKNDTGRGTNYTNEKQRLPSRGDVLDSLDVDVRIQNHDPSFDLAKTGTVDMVEKNTIAKGQFGPVLLTKLMPAGEPIVLKQIIKKHHADGTAWHSDHSLSGTRLDTPVDEVRILSLFTKKYPHPNIIRLMGVVASEEYLYLVEEYGGRSVFELNHLAEQRSSPSKFGSDTNLAMSAQERRSIFRQVVKAIAHMHSKGYCHLDLSTENVVGRYTAEGDLQVKLVDFGCAAKFEVDFLDVKDVAKPYPTGKVACMAPELFHRSHSFNAPAADTWSLGVMLLELCAPSASLWRVPSQDDMRFKGLMASDKAGSLSPLKTICPQLKCLSTQTETLAFQLLRIEPEARLTARQLLVHLKYDWNHGSERSDLPKKGSVQPDATPVMYALKRMIETVPEAEHRLSCKGNHSEDLEPSAMYSYRNLLLLLYNEIATAILPSEKKPAPPGRCSAVLPEARTVFLDGEEIGTVPGIENLHYETEVLYRWSKKEIARGKSKFSSTEQELQFRERIIRVNHIVGLDLDKIDLPQWQFDSPPAPSCCIIH